jgi:predicted nucleotide-binding protein
MAKKSQTSKNPSAQDAKHAYIPQSKIPKMSLAEALKLPQGLHDNFAGKPTAPHQLALAVDISPTSSNWPNLCGASIAYGLTLGGYNAQVISLTELGSRIVAPTAEGDDISAKVEAALKPGIAKDFFENYNRAKFPQDKIAKNVLAQMGVPADRLDSVLEIMKQNGQLVGIIHQTKTGPFVAIDTPNPISANTRSDEVADELPPGGVEQETEVQDTSTQPPTKLNQRVFITHGKNKDIVTQLKDLLTFGKFIPVVAEEHETPSKPVSDKVLEDMRSCFAGIIHVASEDELLDKTGNVHHKINENVLIEIGAAMALYAGNFILLVQKGIHLPSNLQGLYLCYYEGEKLDYEATMKLLKAFSEFK